VPRHLRAGQQHHLGVNTSDTATNTISGTSMATPHVTCAMALYLQTNPGASPATVTQALIQRRNVEPRLEPGHRLSEPAAGLALRRRAGGAASASATSADGADHSILGAYNNASGSEYQTMTIPSSATRNLTFWLNITTQEACCTPYDYMYVEVRNTSGARTKRGALGAPRSVSDHVVRQGLRVTAGVSL
jgi:subtilisin family serine protease